MTEKRPLSVAEFQPGSVAKADTWLNLDRSETNTVANVGIKLNDTNDYVVIRLPSGDKVELYGDGELWFKGTNMIRIVTDELPWR